MLLLAWTLWTPIESAAQAPVCDVPLATLTVPRSSYAEVSADPFEQRLYVYVPEIRAGSGTGFQPFQVWVVEGIYGKPFVLATGSLDEAGFERLRMSPNVRATPVPVVRGDGSESGQFRAARNMYKVQVMSVNASGSGAVQVRICR
jgi:hypothetical protein